MQNTSARDLIVGLFVLAGLGSLAYLSLQVGGLEFSDGGRNFPNREPRISAATRVGI